MRGEEDEEGIREFGRGLVGLGLKSSARAHGRRTSSFSRKREFAMGLKLSSTSAWDLLALARAVPTREESPVVETSNGTWPRKPTHSIRRRARKIQPAA